MANFEKLLSTSISDIKNRLRNKYDNEVKIKTLNYFDTKEYDKLSNEYKTLDKKRDEINKLMREVESKKNKLKPSITFESEEWVKKTLGYYKYWITEPEVQAMKELHDKPIYTNQQEFTNLSSKFMNAMNLWVGTKEKRNILMSFYNLDWKSLWIDIPPEMNFNEVKIKDGKIISDTSKLLSN